MSGLGLTSLVPSSTHHRSRESRRVAQRQVVGEVDHVVEQSRFKLSCCGLLGFSKLTIMRRLWSSEERSTSRCSV